MLVEKPVAYLPIPGLWEGLLVPTTSEATIPSVIGAVARVLVRAPGGDDEDRRLVRALVSVDGPRGDRVWLTAERAGRSITLRDGVAAIAAADGERLEREGLAPWCDALRFDFSGSFDVDPSEVWTRCLPHYHGFLHAWTDEHAARGSYQSWPRARQAAFEHEYLLYAANDRDVAARHGTQVDAGLQQAAAWLRSQRRYVMRWTVVLRAQPLARPAWLRELEPVLIADAEAIRPLLPTTPFDAHSLAMLDAAIAAGSSTAEPPPAWEELLVRLEQTEGRIRPLRLVHGLRRFVPHTSGASDGPLAHALHRLEARLDEAIRWTW